MKETVNYYWPVLKCMVKSDFKNDIGEVKGKLQTNALPSIKISFHVRTVMSKEEHDNNIFRHFTSMLFFPICVYMQLFVLRLDGIRR